MGLGAREVLPNMGYVGMGGPKGSGFSAVLVINGIYLSTSFNSSRDVGAGGAGRGLYPFQAKNT